MMAELNMPATAAAVAHYYSDLLDGFVLDESDSDLASTISSPQLQVCCTPSIMNTLEDRIELASKVLSFAQQLIDNSNMH